MKTATHYVDGEKFKLRSLSVRQMLAIQDSQEDQDTALGRFRKLNDAKSAHNEDPENNPALTDEETAEWKSNKDAEIRELARLVRMSMAKYHPDYAIVNDPNEDRERTNKLFDEMDIADLEAISDFAMSGNRNSLTLTPEEDEASE